MDFEFTARSQAYLAKVQAFVEQEAIPQEIPFLHQSGRLGGEDWRNWTVSPALRALRAKAKEAGLWNLFLPDEKYSPGLSTIEYAPLAEAMGRSLLGAESMNCQAPDSGNVEVLWKYGSKAQQQEWMEPLLRGEIRSAFCMTEPDVASSDATNMRAEAKIVGDEVVLNGKKWWSTGIGHPDCKVVIFMGVTSPEASKHAQHSMVLVPLNTKGVYIQRMLPVFGAWDAPVGHGEVHFDNVRLPLDAIIAGPGRGFEIAQGRLGPGRIHHAMRCIGAAERVLSLMIQRGLKRIAFGKPLLYLNGNMDKVGELRVDIDAARLLTYHAAWRLDQEGPLGAMQSISAIKLVAPRLLQRAADECIQIFGGAGLSDDEVVASFFGLARVLRIADGPDAVHRGLIAKLEVSKYK